MITGTKMISVLVRALWVTHKLCGFTVSSNFRTNIKCILKRKMSKGKQKALFTKISLYNFVLFHLETFIIWYLKNCFHSNVVGILPFTKNV